MMLTTNDVSSLHIREARNSDLAAIRAIYNQGIEDRIATLDDMPRSDADMREWFHAHRGRYAALVAERAERTVGWASLNPYWHRCAYSGVADLSVYVERASRGTGVGSMLLGAIERYAGRGGFHKIVLFALSSNDAGASLYRKMGYRDVGVFKEQGLLDGRFVDVIAMEKFVRRLVLFVCRHNTGRSQMAEAFLRRFVGHAVDVASAGTMAADRPDRGVVAAMAEVEMDISGARPKLLDAGMLARAERIITMGCDVNGLPRVDDDWGVPDPKGQRPQRIREIRDLVCKKAGDLAKDLLQPVS